MGTPQDDRGLAAIVELDRDHPGFRDADYRARRNTIARAALEYRDGAPIPTIDYTEEEHGVWRTAWEHIAPLHDRYACGKYREASALVALDRVRIPQLRDINPALAAATGFSMLPAAGLVTPRAFLTYLARRAFLSTQYVRHHTRPLYTPEPDIIHELIGHAATLAHPDFAALNHALGVAALDADDEQLLGLIRVYWYTLEFGAIYEQGRVRVYGAGLLSSYGELGKFEHSADLRPLDLDEISRTPFDPTDYQKTIFVARSWDEMSSSLLGWLAAR
jgi:phenylalanine-4-hydroxylase